ncbi:MAG: DegV family protein [Lachnospiraceae bacterium]|nr:DegV family protein [Lachnospiraceae bacterium]
MSDYVLSCSSTADLTLDQLKERDIEYICFHYELNGKEYLDDLGQSMDFKDFYDAMRNGASTKTSQIGVGEYEPYFEEFLKEGKDILHISLSSGISGTVNSARIAADDLSEKYPDRKIYIVDSLAASAGFGLFVDKLAELRNGGMDIHELYLWAEDNKLRVNHWFFTSDLTYLVRGGRVSKAAGLVGGMLNICPLLNVDYVGKLIPREKIRTKKKVMKRVVEVMEELADDGLDYEDKVFISQADCYLDAREMADMIEEKFPKMKNRVLINYIGTTIGSHTGPGTVAIFFWGKKRVN